MPIELFMFIAIISTLMFMSFSIVVLMFVLIDTIIKEIEKERKYNESQSACPLEIKNEGVGEGETEMGTREDIQG